MAKKKKGNRSKQKSPLPHNDDTTTSSSTPVNSTNNGDLHPEPEELNTMIPKYKREEEDSVNGKDDEAQNQVLSRDGTDQELSDDNNDEKHSQELDEEVPRDGSQEEEHHTEDQEVQLDDLENVGDEETANDDAVNQESLEDKTEVDITIESEEQPKEIHEDNDRANVERVDEKLTDKEHEGNGKTIGKEEIPNDEENVETVQETPVNNDLDQKQETEHLEVSAIPLRPSISVLSEAKESSDGSILNESKSELQLDTLNTINNPKQQEKPKPKPKPKPTSFVKSSPGPYSIHDIINEIPLYNPDIKGSENAYPTYVEKLNDHIYVGTSHGEILHFFKIENEFILVSRNSFHQSRVRPITKILLLPNIEKALVIAGGLLTCFLLPEFSPANIGRVKEVNDMSLDFDDKTKNDSTGVHVALYTNNQIRIINVTPTAFRLIKDIAYPESRKGLRRSEYSLVASKQNYDLIDLENFQKIPLFPILTVQDETTTQRPTLTPFILPVGQEEFLLTCGISKEEPSMGLVINLNGDISRGTIPLPKYPDSVGINYPYVVSSFDNSVVVNSLHDQSEVQSLEFSGDIKITNVASSFTQPYEDLVDLIRLVPIVGEDTERELKEREFVSKISTISTSLVCFCANFVKILLPQPRLIRLKNFRTIEELDDELKSVEGSTELGVIELEYINLLTGLTHLKSKTYTQAFDIWTNGTVDPRILIYIFKYTVYGDLWIFNGLKELVEQTRNSIKNTKFERFFVMFLDRWVAKESYTENPDIVKSIELANLRESLNDNSKIMKIVEGKINLTLDETIEILKRHGKHSALAKIYMKQGKYKEVLQIYKDLEDGKKKDDSFNKDDGLAIIIDLVYKYLSQDEDLVWEIGLWLINKKPELGLNFFQNEGLNIKIKDEALLISKIDDISLKYKYIEKLLVRLNKDKMRSNLVKNLYKTELKSLNDRIRVYKSHTKE